MLGNSKRKRSLQTARRIVSFENNYLKFNDFEKLFQLLTNFLVEKKLYSSRLDFEFFFKILYWQTMNSNYLVWNILFLLKFKLLKKSWVDWLPN
jgi:hypothetical protein